MDRNDNKKACFLFLSLAILFTPAGRGVANAAISVQENIALGAWPEPVSVSTGDPTINTLVVAATSSHVVSQTFTAATGAKLEAIYFSYSTTAASAAHSFSIRIQQIPGSSVQTYTQAANLLPTSGFTFSLANTGGAVKLMRFTFTGADQISLAGGSVYAVEIASTSSTVRFYRRGSDTYGGGCVYDNRSAINYPNTRDLAMGVVTGAEGEDFVILEEGITPTTAWPVPVTIETASPGVATTSVTVNGSTTASQTFTPAANMTLGSLYFSYSTSAASAPDAFTIKIQEVPGPSVQTYAPGPNLLGASPITFSLDGTGGAVRLMGLEFSGAYRIALSGGTTYAVEISSAGSGLSLYRRGANSYGGGTAYSNRSAINYPNTRDIAMAVVEAQEGGSITAEDLPASSSAFPEPATILTDNPRESTLASTVNGSTVLSQTFTPGKSCQLGAVYLAYSTSAASTANAFTIRIQEVAGPAAASYSQDTNLLASTPASFSLPSTGGAVRALKLTFHGAAQIPLAAGTTYALEISSTGSAASFRRRGANSYSGGMLYVNRSAFNYPDTRDLAIGIIKAGGAGSPVLAGSTSAPVPQIFGIQMLDGDASTNALKDQTAAAGFKFFRRGLYWSRVETSPGVYNFNGYSYNTLINGFISRGLKPYLTLFDGNSLYGEPGREVLTPAGRTGFANFAKAVAQNYPAAEHFEIWNEPNHSWFWSTQPSIQAYVDLAAAVGPAIKSVRPAAKIAGPALAGPGVPFDWLEQAFQRGLLNHIDWVCIHPYRAASVPPETVLPEYAQVRAYIEEYKPAGKQIDIVTGEWGYHSDNTSTGGTRTVQAQYAARMFLINIHAGMPFTSWYSWKDNATTLNETENYGIFTNGLAVKESYTAFQTLATALSGYTHQQRVTFANPDIWVLKFVNASGKPAYAIWTVGTSTSVQIPISAGSGTLKAMLGTSQSISWGSSGPQITATQSPQYLLVN